jgi:3-oxoacyl-[acyl-carrier-protein] synthase II
MEMRRVVVTGLGIVSPLGVGHETVWSNILASKSGAQRVTDFEVGDLACQIACRIPLGDTAEGKFNPDDWMEPKEQRKVDPFIVFAMAASTQALQDAGYKAETLEQQERTGVLIGSGIGGIGGIYDASITLAEKGPRRISPFFIPGRLINLASGYVSIEHGLKGPNHSVVTACSTGAHAIGDAARLIMLGDADVMVAGGAESPVNRLSLAGFAACRALSTGFNDAPETGSRPYDKDRDGFVMGEGAGIVVLEEYEHAKARGAKIYGEVIGYGLSGDAHHITAPAEDGNGGFRSMSAAIKRAGIQPSDIDYINAHGTSTPLGDEIELGAVTRNRRLATFSAPPARWKRSFLCSPCATASPRRPSISTIRRWKPRSTLHPTSRCKRRSTWRCRIPSALAARTRRLSSARRHRAGFGPFGTCFCRISCSIWPCDASGIP